MKFETHVYAKFEDEQAHVQLPCRSMATGRLTREKKTSLWLDCLFDGEADAIMSRSRRSKRAVLIGVDSGERFLLRAVVTQITPTRSGVMHAFGVRYRLKVEGKVVRLMENAR